MATAQRTAKSKKESEVASKQLLRYAITLAAIKIAKTAANHTLELDSSDFGIIEIYGK